MKRPTNTCCNTSAIELQYALSLFDNLTSIVLNSFSKIIATLFFNVTFSISSFGITMLCSPYWFSLSCNILLSPSNCSNPSTLYLGRRSQILSKKSKDHCCICKHIIRSSYNKSTLVCFGTTLCIKYAAACC